MKDYKLIFSELLQDILIEKSLSQREFSKIIGMSQSHMSKVIRGIRPPASPLEDWSTALKLSGEQKREFIELGYIAQSSPYIQKLIHKMQTENKH